MTHRMRDSSVSESFAYQLFSRKSVFAIPVSKAPEVIIRSPSAALITLKWRRVQNRWVIDWQIEVPRLFQQIIWVFEKELRYALRDTDVLIYSVLVPLLIYPGIFLVASEVFLWQMSDAQQHLKVCIKSYQDVPSYFNDVLSHVEGIKITESSNPQYDLELGNLDAFVTETEISNTFNFTTYVNGKKGMLAANRLNQAFLAAQKAQQQLAYKKAGVPEHLLQVCSINETRLVPFTNTQARIESKAPIGILAAVALGLLQIGLTAGVTAVCAFAEEKEKKTFETTLSLPTPSFVITAGKWLASSSISLFSGFANIVAMGAAGLVVLIQAQSMQKQNFIGGVSYLFSGDFWTYTLALIILFLCAGLSSAICMLCVSSSNTFKDAQVIATYPMLFIITLPLLALIPGIEQNQWIYAVPFTNLLLCLKHPQGNYLSLIFSLLESVATIGLCVSIAGKTFFAERGVFAIGNASSSRRPHQQTDSI